MKVVFIKKKAVWLAILVVAVTVIFCVSGIGMTAAGVYLGRVARELPIYNVQTDENKVAISFDAAWGADKTLDILETCKTYNVKATFFLVGFWVEENLEVAKKIVENGFEIGLHSNTHRDFTKLSEEEIILEIQENQKIIKDNLEIDAKLFRCPYGAYNDKVIKTVRGLGLEVVQWDVDTLDWKGLSATEIAGRINNRAKKGSIILCHNNADHIVQGIKLAFETMKLKDFEIVPVGELIYTNDFTINHQGTQIKN